MKRFLRYATGLVVAVLGLLVVYGVAIEPRLVLDERRYEVEVDDLPAALAGTEVAVFSDLQVGMWLANLGMVERVVARTIETAPDAALIGGDFVYSGSPTWPPRSTPSSTC